MSRDFTVRVGAIKEPPLNLYQKKLDEARRIPEHDWVGHAMGYCPEGCNGGRDGT
jgi:hypothetical protein